MDRLLNVLTIEIYRGVLSIESYVPGKGIISSGNTEHEMERAYGKPNTSDGLGYCENESGITEKQL